MFDKNKAKVTTLNLKQWPVTEWHILDSGTIDIEFWTDEKGRKRITIYEGEEGKDFDFSKGVSIELKQK